MTFTCMQVVLFKNHGMEIRWGWDKADVLLLNL